MKGQLLALGLVLPLLLAAQKENPAHDLKEFSVKEGGFSILLPGDPKADVKKTRTPDGKETTNHIYVVDQKTSAFVVAYMIDVNVGKADGPGAKTILENARKGAEGGLRARLISEKDITLDKNPGLEFQLEVAGIGIYRSRVYIAGDKLYQVTVLGPKDVANGKEANRVLDSFKLMK